MWEIYTITLAKLPNLGGKRKQLWHSLNQIILDRLFPEFGFSKYLPTLYVAHYQSMFLGLQRPAIHRSTKLDRHATWMTLSGTRRALARPQNQASLHLSHFLLIAKVRNRFCSQAQKWVCLSLSLFFFITNKTLSSAHRYKCFTVFAYFMPVINPKGRWRYNC